MQVLLGKAGRIHCRGLYTGTACRAKGP
jgi:hypothetical protein